MNEITNSVLVATNSMDVATNALATTAAANGIGGTVFTGLDVVVIIAFALGMLAIIVYSMMKKNESGKDYFLSGRDANWLQIGSSIFSSNIGSEHLVGLAGAGFVSGMAMAHWEMHAYWILILGWAFVPLYDRMKIFTMPEFLELRFSRGSRNILSLLTVASLVLTKIAATIYAGDVVVRTLLNVNTIDIPRLGIHMDVFWAIALGLAFTTGLYTVFGGMRVIMYTAVLQAPVLIFGSVCILYMGLHVLGHGSLVEGWRAMITSAGDNIHLIRSNKDPDFPWLAVLPASAIIGFWYWCTDQYIVQRVLAGRNEKESRQGTILAGFFKLTPVFIFLVPGMIAFALTKTPGSGFSTSGDAAYTSLVGQILPSGMRGLVACGMIVALMASLGSKFNACATLFTMDFYREWHPTASPKTEVVVGRIATAAIVLIGICWVLMIKALHTNLYLYLQNVQGYLSPAIAVLFVGGVFWKRATAPAALWSFGIGVVGGFAKLGADIVLRNDSDTVATLKDQLYHGTITLQQFNDSLAPIKAKYPGWLFDFQQFHQWYYCELLFGITAVLMVVISLMTAPPDPKTIKYTYYGATPEEKAATRASWSAMDVVLSLIVVGCVVLFYIKFW